MNRAVKELVKATSEFCLTQHGGKKVSKDGKRAVWL